MGNNISLKQFIRDMKKVRDNIPKLVQKNKDNIIAHAMKNIGMMTAYDTGVARGVIKDILSKELKRPDLAIELDHTVYNYWESRYGKRTPDDASYIFEKTENGVYKISIIDDGFAGQAEDGKISQTHPRQDQLLVPRQVDYVCDLMNAKMLQDVEKEVDEMTTRILLAIETGRVRGF